MHQNEVLARRYFQEVWNERRLEVVDEILCENCAATDLHSGTDRSREEMKQLCTRLVQAIPDVMITVEEVIADDDRVALRWRARGSSPGPSGPMPVDISGLSLAHIEGGRVTRVWDVWDKLGMLQQLGQVARELDPAVMS
ncbi:ester cyclase [Inquilinus sp.]|jgi:predicted ester cyclase|uniref:ester cyclase n=1 Tax=Inquilinus sp. TaxID=1932117 RepID=UPI003784E005